MPTMRSPSVPALVLLACGCASSGSAAPEPRPAQPAPVLERGPVELGGGYRPLRRHDPATGELREWHDVTVGPTATLIYVTRSGGRGAAGRPAALVFSSDPGNGHFQRETSARVTVRRLYRDEMGALLARLDGGGLRSLPWAPQPYDAPIGPERALLLYEGGVRRRVAKEALEGQQRVTFAELEQTLIDVTLGR